MRSLFFLFVLSAGLLSMSSPVIAAAAPALPNLQYTLGVGYDVRVGFPTMDSIRQPVILLPWESNYTVYYGSQSYVIPESLDYTPTPETDQSSTQQVYIDYHSLTQSLSQSQSVGLPSYSKYGIQIFPGIYSSSTQTQQFSAALQTATVSAYSYLLVKTWKIQADYFYYYGDVNASWFNPRFLQILQKLPIQYTGNSCSQYKAFFNLYGTHFPAAIQFGGQVMMQTSFSQSLYLQKGMQQVQNDLKMQFFLSTQPSLTSDQQQTLANLNVQYQSSIQMVGGTSPGSYQPNQWPVWANTVPQFPVPLSLSLIPYYQLPNSFFNQENPNGLKLATALYLSNPPPALVGKWWPFQKMPLGLYGSAVGVVGSKIYVLGGMSDISNQVTVTTQIYVFDTAAGLWSEAGQTPLLFTDKQAQFYRMVAVGVKDKIYVYSYQVYQYVFNVYDPALQTWNVLKSPPLANGYMELWMLNMDTQPAIISLAMYNSTTNNITISIYDPPNNDWYVYPSVLSSLKNMGIASYNGNIYFMGGCYINPVNNGICDATGDMLMFDTTTNKWSYLEPMPTPRMLFQTVFFNGQIFAIGGSITSNLSFQTSVVEIYDIASRMWFPGVSLPYEISTFGASLVNNVIYQFGGRATYGPSVDSAAALYPVSAQCLM